jgi:hypothetical protein
MTKAKPKLIAFQPTPDLVVALAALQRRDGVNVSEAIRRALREFLKRKGVLALFLSVLVNCFTSDVANAQDAPIARALALLGCHAPSAPIAVVHTARPAFVMSVATAWTDGATVFVNDQSEPYRRALKGDAVALAAALAHEGWHVAHGPAEAPAYAEQLRVLRMLAAKARDIEPVERAARLVTR